MGAALCSAEFVFLLVFHTDQDDPSSSDDEGMPYTRPVKFKAAHGFKGPYDFEQIKVVQDLSGEHMVGLNFHLCFCWTCSAWNSTFHFHLLVYLQKWLPGLFSVKNLILENNSLAKKMKIWLVWPDLQGVKSM